MPGNIGFACLACALLILGIVLTQLTTGRTMIEFRNTDTSTLRKIASELKHDAIDIFATNKIEALKLFNLYMRIVREIRHRENNFWAIAYRYN